MQAYRVEKVVSKNSALELKALPFKAGEVVEVIILPRNNKINEEDNIYSLKGKVLKYENPTGSVAQDDWNVLK